MKKFNISFQIDSKEMLEGREPHNEIRYDLDEPIEAESKEEAIALALAWFQEQSDIDSEIDSENGRITFFNGEEAVEQIYNFKAEEVEDYASEAEKVAEKIRKNPVWDPEDCRELCDMAGILQEWEESDGEGFETVVEKAAEILKVDIY